MEMLLKLSGLGWLSEAVDGYKVYLAGSAKIFLGVSGMVGGVASILLSLQPGTGLAGLWTAVHGPQFLAAKVAVVGGYYSVADGLADIGHRHALSKAQAAPAVPTSPAGTPLVNP